MPELANSKRRLQKATYAPIQPRHVEIDMEQHAKLKRGWEKTSFVRSLAIREAELPRLSAWIEEHNEGEHRQKLLAVLEATTPLISDTSPTGMVHNTPNLAQVSSQDLVDFGHALAESRRAVQAEVETTLGEIRRDLLSTANQVEIGPVGDTPEGQVEIDNSGGTSEAPTDSGPITVEVLGNTLLRTLLGRARTSPPRSSPGAVSTDVISNGDSSTGIRTLVEHAPTLEAVVDWGAVKHPEQIKMLYEAAESFSPVKPLYTATELSEWVVGLADKVKAWGNWTKHIVDGFEERMKVEPVGRLHLERLEMTPVGIEHGELVYSLPLTPKETVNISHKEWSIRSEEFEQIVQDVLEGYSEEGVTEKKDLSQSTESESKHSTAFSLSANYSHFGVSASVGYNSTSDDAQAKKDSRNESVAITRKASSRTRKDHKYSFKVSSVAGTEDREVRVITNPSEKDAMRVDYYQLMRKWRVDLYRYGLRMTYDIVVPNPGSDLMRKLDEVRSLEELIDEPFEFPLPLTAINRTNWDDYAAIYGARVQEPPEATKWVDVHKEYTNEQKVSFYDAFDIDVDPDYEIKSASLQAGFNPDDDHLSDAWFDVARDAPGPSHNSGNHVGYSSGLEHLVGKSGKLSVDYSGNQLRAGTVNAIFALELKTSAYERWRLNAWDAMRGGAEEMYFQNRQTLIERRDKLKDEIGKWDALTLRKMEREEIMKGVLRWLFGPSFDLVPSDIENLFEPVDPNDPNSSDVLNPNTLSNQEWQRVMEFGEFVKYIQQAIEWENVLYFTYPYFWDSPRNWEFKRFLDHPDPRHRAFLRAGSARVVLTIRPGFEKSFAELIETGAFGTLPDDHPYITIAQEIQNYANTHYPGIPAPNPEGGDDEDDVDDAESGELVGRWYEYTPTSALDLSINTVLSDLA